MLGPKYSKWRLTEGSAIWVCMGMLRCKPDGSYWPPLFGSVCCGVGFPKVLRRRYDLAPFPILPQSGRLSGMSLIASCMSAWSIISVTVKQGVRRLRPIVQRYC